ncbi:winged helix-turn-helix transcriptional regulator [Phytoactinopolyspora halotolerans]|uniref:Winged helix-turn-helix transcriptional regulator n=1 Tax=Phytoactinopolyspora halotolerans TaxID=1981512 RepID=A0A6L9S7Y3_9ACTN|nr:winged helix-turn-helix transcriptional regulator [Phytoactinopolyspora halotolerans]
MQDFDPDVRGSEYVYKRLADHIEARVQANQIESGSRLPAERDLAREYRVSIGTARRATKELRDRRLVVTVPAKGNFIVRKVPAQGTAE